MSPFRFLWWIAALAGSTLLLRADPQFRAGAHVTDIAPPHFPVIVNAMFTERSADKVVDPLVAKALVLDDGTVRIAFCVVDSCMVPRDLIDQAKELAAKATGIPTDRMLVSSTHTHSAPAAMGCLGSRVDPRYAAFLPARLAESIIQANARLAPARVAWSVTNDWKHTFNRRWIRRPDRLITDPFGQASVRAHMHPGHVSPDAVGPSGPVDPGLTLLAITTPEGKPVAVLANYSQHYYGSPLLSSDYYGRFARYLADSLGADPDFVAIMSQGTSGDQMWMDYGAPARDIGYDAYAREMAAEVEAMYRRLDWHGHVPIRMAERTLPLRYRTPDAARLDWARNLTRSMGDRIPGTLPEVYAWEAIHLHERQQTELKLQAVRIGGLGIATLPNEVYALTGLKLKAQSPLPVTMNISLANGAEGYIPPPEQHHLGGYTTWPARTAGLEVEAEPRIVATLLSLLEEVAGQPRRIPTDEHGPYARAVLDSKPAAFWRLSEMVMPIAHDASPHSRHANLENGVALFLPGPGSGSGISPEPALTLSRFSGSQINRAIHFAGGRLRAPIQPGATYTVSFWLWNGLPHEARAVTGYLFSHGSDATPDAPGEHLGIGGTHSPEVFGRLFLFNGNRHNQILAGRTQLRPKTWHHVALVRDQSRFRVHLDGHAIPEIDAAFNHIETAPGREVFFGGRSDNLFGLEGRLDEISFHDRALAPAEITDLFNSADLPAATPPPAPIPTPAAIPPVTPPLSPTESLARIQPLPGYRVELVAAEPLVLDPVAIDWDSQGRLWVVEMADYPMGLDGRGRAGGRIRVLRDTDGDGRPDQSTVFAEGLSFPTGLLTWRDGVLVTAAPEILFLRDTDGDGRADQREVVVSGLMEGNQQLRVNGLRWGLDNRVHCAAGAHHPGHGTSTRLRTRAGEFAVGSRDFHFNPDTGDLEPESGPSQFGRNRDDWGNWFGTQNIRPLWHYVLSDRYLHRNPHVPTPDPTRLVVTPLSPVVYPISTPERRYHSFNEAGHFTSACAGMILRDPLLFPESIGVRHAFTCEPFHNLVQHNLVSEDATSFSSQRSPAEAGREFFASSDRWCRPVMARTGPDGALWIVDMYRYMIEHPDWLPPEGKADLLPHYRLGEDRGRLYRILPETGPARSIPNLAASTTYQLAELLHSPNGWIRDKAHQLLLWKADTAAIAPLQQLAANPVAAPLARVHALWILQGLGFLPAEIIRSAFNSTEPGLRINALRLAESHPSLAPHAVRLATDPSPHVRLQLACSLGEWTAPVAGEALAQLALADHADPYLRAAILSSAIPHLDALCQAVSQADDAVRDSLADSLTQVALGLGQPDRIVTLLQPHLRPGRTDPFTAANARAVTRFLTTLSRRQIPLETLQAGDGPLARTLRELEPLAQWALQTASLAAPNTDPDTRIAAGSFLAQFNPTRPAAIPILATWLDPGQSDTLQRAALTALAVTGDPSVASVILGRWSGLTPSLREAALDLLLSRESWTLAFLDHARRQSFSPPAAVRRDALLRHRSDAVRSQASKWFESPGPRAGMIARFKPALDLTPTDARAGFDTYQRLCSACHQAGGHGRQIGPDVVTFATHAPERILANVLDPSADIQPGFSAYQARLHDGRELIGLVESDSGNSLILRLTDGSRHTLLRTELAALEDTGRSLMPDGLESGLSLQDMANLIAFLRNPSSTGTTAERHP